MRMLSIWSKKKSDVPDDDERTSFNVIENDGAIAYQAHFIQVPGPIQDTAILEYYKRKAYFVGMFMLLCRSLFNGHVSHNRWFVFFCFFFFIGSIDFRLQLFGTFIRCMDDGFAIPIKLLTKIRTTWGWVSEKRQRRKHSERLAVYYKSPATAIRWNECELETFF